MTTKCSYACTKVKCLDNLGVEIIEVQIIDVAL